jgi:hypothetical protein
VIPAITVPEPGNPSLDHLRELVDSKKVRVLGEVLLQYAGISPADPRFEPYWDLAEQKDIPVGIHIGPGPAGAVDLWNQKQYRVAQRPRVARTRPHSASETARVREAGLTPAQAVDVVDRRPERLKEFARYIIAHIYASVLGSREALTNGPFVSNLSLRNTVFDPAAMKSAYAPYAGSRDVHRWNLNPFALENYIVEAETLAATATELTP